VTCVEIIDIDCIVFLFQSTYCEGYLYLSMSSPLSMSSLCRPTDVRLTPYQRVTATASSCWSSKLRHRHRPTPNRRASHAIPSSHSNNINSHHRLTASSCWSSKQMHYVTATATAQRPTDAIPFTFIESQQQHQLTSSSCWSSRLKCTTPLPNAQQMCV
jgi:hypothetical protein